MKKLILPCFLLLANTVAHAQGQQFVKDLERALAVEDTASSYSSVVSAAKNLEYLTEEYPDQWLGLYWTAHVYSQCAVFSRSSHQPYKYADYLDLAQAFYERAWEANKNRSKADVSDFYVLQANIFDLRVGQYRKDRNWEKVREYETLGKEALHKSRAANPNNPMVWTLEGIDKLSDPNTRVEGRRHLAEAIKKYEQYPPASSIHPRWGRQWIDFWLRRYSTTAESK